MNVSRKIDVQFFGDRTTSSLQIQKISKFLDGFGIMKQNMTRTGYEKAVKEAFIELVRTSETSHKPEPTAIQETNDLPKENTAIPSVRRSPRFRNASEKCTVTSAVMHNTVRRSQRLAIEGLKMPIEKSHAQHVAVIVRRSERLRQKKHI